MAAALQVMRQEGLERLTMRRLATELDTGPASLYVYVRNTAELHGAILDELVAGLEPPATGEWRERLIELLCAYTDLLFAYPGLARSVLLLRPSGPHFLRLLDVMLGLLLAGGLPARQAAWGVDILVQQATAIAAEQSSRDESADADGEERELALVLAEAREDVFPHLVRVRDELLSGTGDQRRRWSFGTLIDGLRAG